MSLKNPITGQNTHKRFANNSVIGTGTNNFNHGPTGPVGATGPAGPAGNSSLPTLPIVDGVYTLTVCNGLGTWTK